MSTIHKEVQIHPNTLLSIHYTCISLDHSCNKYCNLIGQEEVTNSDRYLHDSYRHLRVFDRHLQLYILGQKCNFHKMKCMVHTTVQCHMYNAILYNGVTY